jgi:hypothetical protein
MEQTEQIAESEEVEETGQAKAREHPLALSRRDFLRAAGVAAVTVAGGATLTGCGGASPTPAAPASLPALPVAGQGSVVPYPPAEPPTPGLLRFFNLHEAQTVEALTARILPGAPDDPGAREAGVVYYIDNLLSQQGGFVEPTYHRPPFAQTYSGDEPPENAAGEYRVIWTPEAEIERYGYQSIFTPSEVFRMGVAALDRYALARFEDNFVALSEAQQDEIVTALVEESATGFEPLSAKAFFLVVRRYTGEGMFSDPAYGGNRGKVGWKLIGYPGAQRAYLPGEIGEPGSGLARPVWSLADMPHFHAGQQVEDNAILPVSGSNGRHHRDEVTR